MPKRGRQSAASLSVVTALPKRMPPPESLTEAQAQVWRDVVDAKPVGYFDAPAGHLLALFCGAVCSSDRLSEMINALDLAEIGEPRVLRQFDRLLSMRDRQTRLMTSLARSLRLTVQATRRADSAENRSVTSGARRPWERIDQGESDDP